MHKVANKTCLNCQMDFPKNPKDTHEYFQRRKHCSVACYNAWKKGRVTPPPRTGSIPWNKGNDRRSDCLGCGNKCASKYCRKCLRGDKVYNYKGPLPKCLTCSIQLSRRDSSYCRTCAGKLRRGANSYSWKGGMSPLVRRVRDCPEYRVWRTTVFARDNYTCVFCKARSGQGKAVVLHVDHFPKMFKSILEEFNIRTYEEAISCKDLWDINNGRTLCVDCHRKTDNYGALANKYKKHEYHR